MAQPIPVATGLGDVQVSTGAQKVSGLSARESGTVATAASFVLRNGTTATAPAVIFVELAADGATNLNYADPIRFPDGIFLDRVSGETQVTVFVK